MGSLLQAQGLSFARCEAGRLKNVVSVPSLLAFPTFIIQARSRAYNLFATDIYNFKFFK